MDWYRDAVRPLLFRLPPETAHDLMAAALRAHGLWSWVGDRYRVADTRLEVDRSAAWSDPDDPCA